MLPLVTSSHLQQQQEQQQQHHLMSNQHNNMMASSTGGRHRLIGGTLIISSITPEDQGRYVCSVNNSMGLVESRTELIFRDKLQVRIIELHNHINQQLTDGPAAQHLQIVDAETSVVITCLYSGSPRFLNI